MADFNQICCDSDEEVFWGPMTAKEIELDWRRLLASKNKKENVEGEDGANKRLDSCMIDSLEKTCSNTCQDRDVVVGDTEEGKEHLSQVESKEGFLTETVKTDVSLEDADKNELNTSSDMAEVRFRESTSSAKSFISVKGENKYEVFIPFSPSVQQKVTPDSKVSGNDGIASKADFDDMDLNDNSFLEVKVAHGSNEQDSVFLENLEPQEPEKCVQNISKNEAEEVPIHFDLENIAYIDEQNGSMATDIQIVPSNSVSADVIGECQINSDRDKSLKMCTLSESHNEIKNITSETEEAAAIIVEELKTKVESMDLNSSYFNDQELSHNEPCGSNEIPFTFDPKKTLPDSVPEVTSTSMDEKNCGVQRDSSDLSFVSLSEEKENNGDIEVIRTEEMETYTPPDKKQKYDDKLKLKENEGSDVNKPKRSNIPLLSSTKLPILKPSKLNVPSGTQWSSDFKMKKVPKPKKPEYVVSPAKLSSLLKLNSVKKLTTSQSVGNVYQRPTSAPLQPNNRLYNTPLSKFKHNSSSTLETPVNQKIPVKINPSSAYSLRTPTKNPKYKDIASPVAEYIKSSKSLIVRNVTPSKTINELPKETPISKDHEKKIGPKPVRLAPAYYSQTSQILHSPKEKSSPVLPKLGEKQTSVLITPKPQVFRHIGRVKSEEKNIGKQVFVPRPFRRTSLHETSYAHLPQSSNNDLNVSVLESQ